MVCSRETYPSCSRKHGSRLTWQRLLVLSGFPSWPLPTLWAGILQTPAPTWRHRQAPPGTTGLGNAVSTVQLTLRCVLLEIFACHTVDKHRLIIPGFILLTVIFVVNLELDKQSLFFYGSLRTFISIILLESWNESAHNKCKKKCISLFQWRLLGI